MVSKVKQRLIVNIITQWAAREQHIRGQRSLCNNNNMADPAITAQPALCVMVPSTQTNKQTHKLHI